MKVVYTLMLACSTSLNAFAQTSSVAAGSDPLKMARAINEATANKYVELAYFWQSLEIDEGQFAVCGGDCHAEVRYVELNRRPGRELLLKLTHSYDSCRYLIYEGRAGAWKFVGHVDHDFNRYQMARHRVVQFGGRPWLVIRGQEGSGSGFSLYAETWYEVGLAGVRPVLHYPVEGHTYPWPTGMGRKFRARINSTGVHKNLSLTYIVNYYAYESPKDFPLFVNRREALFSWDKNERIFRFDERASTISTSEIDAIANIEDRSAAEEEGEATIGNTKFYSKNKQFVGGGYEVFVRHNFRGLMKIASDRKNTKREWLRQFLQDCDDSQEKQDLLLALDK